jgi:hypothetical protein
MHILNTDQRRGDRDSWRPQYRADNRACLRSTLAGHTLECAELDKCDELPLERPQDKAKRAQAVLNSIKPQSQAGPTGSLAVCPERMPRT